MTSVSMSLPNDSAAPDYSPELRTAMRLAREAGAIVKTFYDVPPTVRWKDPTEPVTEADRAVNAYLVKQIGQLFGVHEATASRWVTRAQTSVRKAVEYAAQIATGLAVSVMFGRAAIDQAEVGEMKRSFTARYGAPECESDADACQWKRGEFYIGLAVYRGMLTMKLADATAEDRLSQAAPE